MAATLQSRDSTQKKTQQEEGRRKLEKARILHNIVGLLLLNKWYMSLWFNPPSKKNSSVIKRKEFPHYLSMKKMINSTHACHSELPWKRLFYKSVHFCAWASWTSKTSKTWRDPSTKSWLVHGPPLSCSTRTGRSPLQANLWPWHNLTHGMNQTPVTTFYRELTYCKCFMISHLIGSLQEITQWQSHCHPRFYKLKTTNPAPWGDIPDATLSAGGNRARFWNQMCFWSPSPRVYENYLPVPFSSNTSHHTLGAETGLLAARALVTSHTFRLQCVSKDPCCSPITTTVIRQLIATGSPFPQPVLSLAVAWTFQRYKTTSFQNLALSLGPPHGRRYTSFFNALKIRRNRETAPVYLWDQARAFPVVQLCTI